MVKAPALDIDYIAKLARLTLTSSEKERFSRELKDVLVHVEKLKEQDLKEVAPTFQTTGSTDTLREDAIEEKRILSPNEDIANAKSKERGLFKVPKVL